MTITPENITAFSLGFVSGVFSVVLIIYLWVSKTFKGSDING